MNYQAQWFGKTDYIKSLQEMQLTAEKSRLTGDIYVMGFEYDAVVTLGLRANKDLQTTEHSGFPVVLVNRGGLATLHNPGQAVIYPIVPIKKLKIFAKKWVETITNVTQKTLDKCNIIVLSKEIGVFTKNGKIASIGININKGVSTHGIAINVSNNTDDFKKIIPCGNALQTFDRVANYKNITTSDYFELWQSEFRQYMISHLEQNLTNTSLTL